MTNLKTIKPNNEWKNITEYMNIENDVIYSMYNNGGNTILFFLGENPQDENATILKVGYELIYKKGANNLYVKSIGETSELRISNNRN